MSQRPIVYVVDDNRDQAEASCELLAMAGFDTEIFESGECFLKLENLADPGCVLLDNQMPGMTGLDVQQELSNRNERIPIVFMSGDSEFRHVVKAMKSGAYEFLQKPFNAAELGVSIVNAIAESQAGHATGEQPSERDDRLDKLTRREAEVLELLNLGYTNKMIAAELNIVISTVEFHRANLMRKLDANSLADLIAILRGGKTAP